MMGRRINAKCILLHHTGHIYNLHVRQTAMPEKEAEEDMKFSLTNLLPWYSLKLSWITTVC